MEKSIQKYLKNIGKKGGKARTDKKVSAARLNVAKARDARKKLKGENK